MNKDKEIKKYPDIGKVYRHYKGGKYKIVTPLAKHSETDETMVVYKSLYFGSVHVRPLTMWFDEIQLTDGKVERFERIKLGWIYETYYFLFRFITQ